jgi:hypothetical protein
MTERRCARCGKRTRADLPIGVPRRPFGARLTAVIALLSARYRLSRREVRQLLQDLWDVRLSLGAVVCQEQVQSAALAPIVEEARAAVQRKAAGLCRELVKWWAALWTFARVEGVEPTNNAAERALRPAVLWRKDSFGWDSEASSRFAERLLTVVTCCRQQGRRLLEFLVAAGEAVLHDTAAPSLLQAPHGG